MPYLKTVKPGLTSFILSLFCFPLFFTRNPDDNIDGSWIRAINLAIKKGLTFGDGFIFTYGPMGFLSTRNERFINASVIFLGDVFLFLGIWHFCNKHITSKKGWILLMLAALILFRDAHYSQTLFAVFVIYSTLILANNFASKLELAYTAIAGILLFYIKVNYGLVSMLLLTVVSTILSVKDWKRSIFFISISAATFLTIYLNVKIDLPHYVQNSMVLFRHYDEAMYYKLPYTDPVLISATFLLVLFQCVVIYQCITWHKQKTLTINKVAILLTSSVSAILFYRNGFTRADDLHYPEFFAVFSLFTIAVLLILNLPARTARTIAIGTIVITAANLILPQIAKGSINLRLLTPVAYFTDMINRPQANNISTCELNKSDNKLIGQSTIDIIPDKIALPDQNGLNYAPRPVPQSYTVYSYELDSINAAFFQNSERPQYVMIKTDQFDNRYDFWNESLTKACLHLNYNYNEKDIYDYLLLSSTEKHVSPLFEMQSTRVARLTDTIHLEPGSGAIYLTADINYSLWGQAFRLAYQAPALNIIFFLEDGTSYEYTAVCPMLKIPSLINKFVGNNDDLKKFLSGNLRDCRTIKSFTFRPLSAGLQPVYTLSLLKYTNY